LLYYDDEVLKPSNSGRLIADLFPDTFAFIWQRTAVEPDLLTLLQDPTWLPIVVFPEEYAAPDRVLCQPTAPDLQGRRPLFILLDGSWREAKKMFRNSPYLDAFPVWSVTPSGPSRYQVRKAAKEVQLATAEVAAMVLAELGETTNAALLHAWFDLFGFRYQMGVKRVNQGDAGAEARLLALRPGRNPT
jgi:DTW domain-containing protein YfiP